MQVNFVSCPLTDCPHRFSWFACASQLKGHVKYCFWFTLTHLALNFFYLILILPYLPFVSVFPWEIFSHPFIFSPSECACGVCRLFDLALGFQQNFFKMILEYKSIHSFNKYLLRDEAPSKKPRKISPSWRPCYSL